MKKTSWKTLAMLFSIPALALIAYGVIYACGGDWDGDYVESSFTPEVYVDESYTPFFYSPGDMFYYAGDYQFDHITRFNDDIAAAWSEYLKGRLSGDQVSSILLAKDADGVGQLYTALQKKQQPPAAYSRINLVDERVKGFIVFMHLAKEIEAVSTRPEYGWEDDESGNPTVVSPQTVVRAEQLYASAKDEFLKNRYWFQAMKANFYSARQQNATVFFEKTKNNVPKNTLYYRAMAYVAGVAYKQKQYATSNYLYSVVFENCPALRLVATFAFHPQEDADFQASLALAKNTDEKAALWSLFGYYADEQRAIQEIYQLSPKSSHLEYLLSRLVNKEEERMNSVEYSSDGVHYKDLDAKVEPQILELVMKLAKEGKTSKPYLWNLAAGYLSIFNGDHTQATQLFNKVEKEAPKSDLAANQLRIFRFTNTLHSTTRMDATAESRLLPELTWLYATGERATVRYDHAVNWSKRYIARLYRNQGNSAMGELFHRDRTYYRTPANLEAMKAFLQKTSYTAWEKMAVSLYDVKLDDIYEYEGIMAAYAGKIDNAIALMQKANATEELYGNPFNGKIQDCHDCDHAASQKVKYTKVSFLQKMKEMQSHVDKKEDIYNNSLLLANAYYNMSYFGNARAFYYNNIITDQYGNDFEEYYNPQFLSCATADRYYKIAFAAATTDEQRAKCVYMMAKCERNEKFQGDPENESLAWEGFKQLKAKYAHTKYYQEVLNECSYFSIYLNRGH